ncbi:MAG TPA: phage holin family protein [Gaiellaceae bacterium]
MKEHARRVVELELELAALEVKQKMASLGVGLGLLIACALFAFFALGFVLAGAAAGLATFMPVWGALLIVAAVLALLAGTLAALGVRSVKKASPPVPELALLEAKLTSEALKNGKG